MQKLFPKLLKHLNEFSAAYTILLAAITGALGFVGGIIITIIPSEAEKIQALTEEPVFSVQYLEMNDSLYAKFGGIEDIATGVADQSLFIFPIFNFGFGEKLNDGLRGGSEAINAGLGDNTLWRVGEFDYESEIFDLNHLIISVFQTGGSIARDVEIVFEKRVNGNGEFALGNSAHLTPLSTLKRDGSGVILECNDWSTVGEYVIDIGDIRPGDGRTFELQAYTSFREAIESTSISLQTASDTMSTEPTCSRFFREPGVIFYSTSYFPKFIRYKTVSGAVRVNEIRRPTSYLVPVFRGLRAGG